MANDYKVLGQSAPSATTDTDLYTVPASTEAIVSTLFIANRGGSAATYRVAVRPAGAAIDDEHYLFYDVSIDANSSVRVPAGIALAATDVVTVYASTADLSFSLFGSEIA